MPFTLRPAKVSKGSRQMQDKRPERVQDQPPGTRVPPIFAPRLWGDPVTKNPACFIRRDDGGRNSMRQVLRTQIMADGIDAPSAGHNGRSIAKKKVKESRNVIRH